MKRMTVKEIQDVSLIILERIDAFCKERGIRYFLDFGTLLGAARHKGFIPWDDDADVRMPRRDYERFVKEFIDDDKYRLYAPARGNSYISYARLCEMNDTFFSQGVPWTWESPGVGVDILPLDGAPDTMEEYMRLSVPMNKAMMKLRKIRWSLGRRKFRRDILGFLKDCIHWMSVSIYRLNVPYFTRRLVRKIEAIRKLHDYDKSEYCFTSALSMSPRGWWRKEWFSDVVYLDFCGKKFPAPIGYDERLTAEYGEWRKLPPEEQRKGHTGSQIMYWRDR